MRRVGQFVSIAIFAVLQVGAAHAAIDVLINKRSQTMSVTIDGRPTYHWQVSTGRSGYATPSGSFRGTRLEEVYYSKKYDNAPMPNAIFFTSAGHAIHGTYETKRLGSAVSHGCVRLAPQHAATLFQLVEAEGLQNFHVTIVGNAPKGIVKRRVAPPVERGWQDEPDWSDGGLEPFPPPWEEGPSEDFYGYDWGPWN